MTGSSALARDVVRAIATARGWPDFGPRVRTAVTISDAAMARLAGRYRYRSGEFSVRLDHGSLSIASPGDEPDAAFAASANEIFTLTEDATFLFDPDEGPARSGRVLVGAAELAFRRLD